MAEYDEQCHWCGKVLTGPHKNEYKPIGGEGNELYTQKFCPECENNFVRQSREKTAVRFRRAYAKPLEADAMPGYTELQQKRRRGAAWDELMRDLRRDT